MFNHYQPIDTDWNRCQPLWFTPATVLSVPHSEQRWGEAMATKWHGNSRNSGAHLGSPVPKKLSCEENRTLPLDAWLESIQHDPLYGVTSIVIKSSLIAPAVICLATLAMALLPAASSFSKTSGFGVTWSCPWWILTFQKTKEMIQLP